MATPLPLLYHQSSEHQNTAGISNLIETVKQTACLVRDGSFHILLKKKNKKNRYYIINDQ